MSQKQYLDIEGAQLLIDYLNTQLDNKSENIELPDDLVHTADLDPYALRTELNGLVNTSALATALTGYARSSDIPDVSNFVSSSDLQRIENKISGVYHFRGNVANLAALQAVQNPEVGDVYNLLDTGMNAAWTGTAWDDFGTTVDLSGYVREEDVQSIALAQLNAMLYSGKSAVVNTIDAVSAMLASDEPEVEIVLNKNLAAAAPIEIPTGKTVTLDLGGQTLSSGNNYALEVNGGILVLKNGTVETTGTGDTARPVVVFSGSVTVDGAEVISQHDCAISATGSNSEVIIESGRVQAQESGVLVTSGASVIVNGGEIECTDNCPLQGNGTAGKGNVSMVMNGGKLIAHITSAGYAACGVYMPNSGSFVMNGGEIESDGCGICMRGGTVQLNAGKVTATGTAGSVGKVGDSRIVVGPYAIVYDAQSKYPAMDTLNLVIENGVVLNGTDGEISYILQDGTAANVTDNRQNTVINN